MYGIFAYATSSGELARDSIFHTIHKEKYKYFVENALKIGYDMAEKYADAKLEEILATENITIVEVATSGIFHKIRFRAQYIVRNNEKKI